MVLGRDESERYGLGTHFRHRGETAVVTPPVTTAAPARLRPHSEQRRYSNAVIRVPVCWKIASSQRQDEKTFSKLKNYSKGHFIALSLRKCQGASFFSPREKNCSIKPAFCRQVRTRGISVREFNRNQEEDANVLPRLWKLHPQDRHIRGEGSAPPFHLQVLADCLYLETSKNSRWLSCKPSTRPSAIPCP